MRLIDADALINVLKDPPVHASLCGMTMADVLSLVDEAPTIDAVPVVRCKDCEYWKVETEQCDLFDADDYCSMAKRKAEP